MNFSKLKLNEDATAMNAMAAATEKAAAGGQKQKEGIAAKTAEVMKKQLVQDILHAQEQAERGHAHLAPSEHTLLLAEL